MGDCGSFEDHPLITQSFTPRALRFPQNFRRRARTGLSTSGYTAQPSKRAAIRRPVHLQLRVGFARELVLSGASCEQVPTSLFKKLPGTFFTYSRSSVVRSGPGLVRMSNTVSSSSVNCSRTWRCCSSLSARLKANNSWNNSSMLRLPALYDSINSSNLARCWQCDRDTRAQGRFQSETPQTSRAQPSSIAGPRPRSQLA